MTRPEYTIEVALRILETSTDSELRQKAETLLSFFLDDEIERIVNGESEEPKGSET